MAIDLKEFQLILLRTPHDAPSYDEQPTQRIQRAHLAFYAALREAGHVVANGPVRDQPDEALRGIAIYAMQSLARARELAGTDPAVQVGRLQVQAMSYLCPPGTTTRSGIPITIED